MNISVEDVAIEYFESFGEMLKFLRRRAGLTQKELSIFVGYSESQISRLEKNLRTPDVSTIAARFLPVLDLQDNPHLAERLIRLAERTRVPK